MKKKTFKVEGMTCNGCAGTVANILTMQKGVDSADVQYPENIAEVNFNPEVITEERMREVVKMMGYKLI